MTLGCLQSDYCPVTTGQLPECINNDKSLHWKSLFSALKSLKYNNKIMAFYNLKKKPALTTKEGETETMYADIV